MSILDNNPYDFDIYYSLEVTPIGSKKYYFFDKPNEKTKKISVKALNSEWENMSTALEESTYINHITGQPLLRKKTFFECILSNFILEVTFAEETPPEVIRLGDFNRLNYKVIREVVKTWLKYN